MVSKTLLIGMGIVIALYLLYRILFGAGKMDSEFDQAYEKVLTADEYKVKGQHDK